MSYLLGAVADYHAGWRDLWQGLWSSRSVGRREEIMRLRRRIAQLESRVYVTSIELESARKNASVDLLTGIPNRRAYVDRLKED